MSVDVSNITLFANQDPYFITVAQAQPNLGTLISLTVPINALPYSAILVSSTQIILNLGFVPATVNTSSSQYTISGPSSITVGSAVYIPGNVFITLNVTGTFIAGSYFVTLGPNTFFDVNGNFNSVLPTPILIVASPTMQYQSIVGGLSQLTLTYSLPPTLSGPALTPSSWIITGGGLPVSVTNVATGGNTVILNVTPQTQGSSYVVNMPAGISGTSGGTPIALSGSFLAPFTGTGTGPFVVVAYPEEATILDVIFNVPVQPAGALISANYVVNLGLSVISVSQLSASTYRLITSPQTAGTVYLLTVSNIVDTSGNPI